MGLLDGIKKNRFIFILLLIVFVLFLIFNFFNSSLLWDENSYLGNARSHVSQSNYTEDFRFPLLEWIIALFWIFGESLFVIKLVLILLTIATIFLVFLISKEYFEEDFSHNTAKLLTISFALCPLILVWGFRVYADIPSLFFVTLSFYLIVLSERVKNRAFVLLSLAGIFASLAFLSRFSLMLFAFSAVIYLLYGRKFKGAGFFSLFFILTLIPWFLYNLNLYHNIIWDLIAQYNVVKLYTSNYLEPISKQIFNLFIYTGIISVFFLFGIYKNVVSWFQKRSFNGIRLLVLFYVVISMVYYLLFVNLKDARYYLAFLPFIYLLAFDGYRFIRSKIDKEVIKKIIIILLIINLLFLSIYGARMALPTFDCKGDALAESINYLRPEAEILRDKNKVILSNFWPYFGYSLNTKVASLWSPSLNELFASYNIGYIGYIVYSGALGEQYNLTVLNNDPRLMLDKSFSDKCKEIYIYDVKSF